jgi:LysR family glycine cleavage system transcriptional activator
MTCAEGSKNCKAANAYRREKSADGSGPVKYRLPPLNALRAFEAAARHTNISHAADELCVSAGAISRHVAILERHLGCQLLIRQHRGVTPTDPGLRYLKEIAVAFDTIDKASWSLCRSKHTSGLRVRLFTTLSSDWLSPRIRTFRAAYPDIHLNLSASLQPPNFAVEDVDIGMMLGPGDWPDLHCEVLFRGSFTPVCTPALLDAEYPLRSPDDLRHHDLLYSQLQFARWEEWLSLAGVKGIDTSAGLRFESSSHAYLAARQGAGVAMGQTFFLLDDLRSGRLVAPFELRVEHPLSYCLVCLRSRKDEPEIAAFREWIVAEVRRTTGEVETINAVPDTEHDIVEGTNASAD